MCIIVNMRRYLITSGPAHLLNLMLLVIALFALFMGDIELIA